MTKEPTVWDSLPNVKIDPESLLSMFEVGCREAYDFIFMQVQDGRKRKKSSCSSNSSKGPKSLKLMVLEYKRSNAICIALKRLPPLR